MKYKFGNFIITNLSLELFQYKISLAEADKVVVKLSSVSVDVSASIIQLKYSN